MALAAEPVPEAVELAPEAPADVGLVVLPLPLAVGEAVAEESAPVLDTAVDEPDAVLVVEDEEEEEEDEPPVTLNWFYTTEANRRLVNVTKIQAWGGLDLSTYRLSVDLLGLGAVGQVDGKVVAGGELAAVDLERAVAGLDVGGEQDVGGRVGDLVGKVDVEGGLVAGDGLPLDGVLLTRAPVGVGVGRGDLEGKGARGEREDGQRGNHFED